MILTVAFGIYALETQYFRRRPACLHGITLYCDNVKVYITAMFLRDDHLLIN